MTPMSKMYSTMLKLRRAKNRHGQPLRAITMFSSDTYTNFLRVLEALVTLETGTEEIRQKLKNYNGFSASSAFTTIAKLNLEGGNVDLPKQMHLVTPEHLKDIMVAHGHKEMLEELDV